MTAFIRLLGVLCALLAWPADAAERHNWFNDPFLQLSAGHPHCPAPVGPLLTEADKRAQSHHRIESGSLCFLAGTCQHASAYDYDQTIAAEAAHRFANGDPLLRGATFWITVQRRYVFVEGCAASRHQVARLEEELRLLPYVLYVGSDRVWLGGKALSFR
jgi:hypothetical protein